MRTIYAMALVAGLVLAGEKDKDAPKAAPAGLDNAGQAAKESKRNKRQRFMDFAAETNKQYKTQGEFIEREVRWEENDDQIMKKNEERKEKKNAVKLKHNFTSDWTMEEFEAFALGIRLSEANLENAAKFTKGKGKPAEARTKQTTKKEAMADKETAEIDVDGGRRLQVSPYDLDQTADTTAADQVIVEDERVIVNHATSGHMTPVKNQGSCGACWAFAANSVLEGTVSALTGRDPVALSEGQLVDCSSGTQENIAMFGGNFGNAGCNGGFMDRAWFFHRLAGAMPADVYPYKTVEESCKHSPSRVIQRVQGWGQIPTGTDLTQVKEKLQQQPLAIAMYASDLDFRFYSEGIYEGKLDDGSPIPTSVNHGMTLVGYMEAGEAELIETTTFKYERVTMWMGPYPYSTWQLVPVVTTEVQLSEEAWIVMNSWGPSWGDNGFIKIKIDEDAGVGGINQYMLYVQPYLV